MSLTVGLLGFGTIGREVAGAIAAERIDARLVAVLDHHPGETETALEDLFEGDAPPVVSSLEDLTAEADLVIEAAGGPAVDEAAVATLDAGCDLLVMSVGAFADQDLLERVMDAAGRNDASVHAPSGAIAGLDAVKTAAVTGDLEAVSLTTTKPPEGLAGAPYVSQQGIDLDSIDRPTVVFEGSAREAAPAFPSNINVAMALALAGIGPDRTEVSIVADPDESNNVHHIEASGRVGEIETTVRNVPSPTNPKTSYLAAVSAIETLRGMTSTLRVGT